MKNKLLMALCALLTFFATTGCDNDDDDVIYDWVPISMYVTVHNSDGADLLDPQSDACISNGAVFNYRGQSYDLTKKLSKAFRPTFDGFVLLHEDGYTLYFGELDGNSSYDDDFEIVWADGSKDVVHLKRKKSSTSASDNWTYNGKTVGDNPTLRLDIVK